MHAAKRDIAREAENGIEKSTKPRYYQHRITVA
jgi:hypothetical protein